MSSFSALAFVFVVTPAAFRIKEYRSRVFRRVKPDGSQAFPQARTRGRIPGRGARYAAVSDFAKIGATTKPSVESFHWTI